MAQVTSGSVLTNSYEGRYYQLDWTCTQSVENNETTINWTLKAMGQAGAWYAERTLRVVIGGVTAYSKSTRVERYDGVVASGTKVITHDSVGDASMTISISAAVFVSAVNCTGSATFELKNIPRKSSLTVDSGTLGTGQTLTVVRNSTAFTHTIEYECGTASGMICTGSTEESISFTPPLALASQNTTGVTVSIKYRITTYDGSTNIGFNEYTKSYFIPESVAPSVSASISEATAITWGVYVQNVSQLTVSISATPAYGSEIASYKTTIDGKSYTGSSFTTDILKNSGDVEISTVVTDKRGRSTTVQKTITVVEYSLPSIKNVSVVRCDSDGTANVKGTYAKVTYSYSFASVSSKNALTIKTEYKKKSDSAYTTLATDSYTVSNLTGIATKIFSANTMTSYDVQIIAEDTVCVCLGNSITSFTSIGTISKFLSMYKQIGLAIGKVFDTSKKETVQVAWDAYFDKDVYIKDTFVRAKRCIVGRNSSSNDNPWYKFASITTSEENEDIRISFKVTISYGSSTRFGILNAYVRTGNSIGGLGARKIEFECDTGFDTNDFVMAYSGTEPGAVYELWVKLEAWEFCMFEVLSESSRIAFVDKWVLFNHITDESGESPTAAYSQITATRPYSIKEADYIVEVGTDDIWTYRKWNSGVAECWGKKNHGTIACTNAWGNLYESTTTVSEFFPSGLFIETPETIDISVLETSSALMIKRCENAPSAEHSGDFGLCCATPVTASNVTLSYYVVGKWK